ncbi:LOW QUALITY PROTEIN: hypothetical protein U0070_025468, partial [Myodes glareolus]
SAPSPWKPGFHAPVTRGGASCGSSPAGYQACGQLVQLRAPFSLHFPRSLLRVPYIRRTAVQLRAVFRGSVLPATRRILPGSPSLSAAWTRPRASGLVTAAPEVAGVEGAMEEPPVREEEDEEDDEGALAKSPLQLTTDDVYDISYVVGRELMALGSDPRVTRLQFKIVRVMEMLEALVNESSLVAEELRMERDNLRQEVEGLRRAGASGGQVNLGPDKMVVDLTDPNRPRFTLQELKDVLQERNKLKSQLLLVQEELQCYRSGLLPPREAPRGGREKDAVVTMGNSEKEERTIMKKLFSFRSGKHT